MNKIIFAFFLFTGLSFSQDIDYKYGPDKTLTENNLSIYDQFYKQKNYVDAYKSWKYLLINAPARTKMVAPTKDNDPRLRTQHCASTAVHHV